MGSGIYGTQQDHDTHEFIAAEVPFSAVASPPMEMLPVWGADNQCLKKERRFSLRVYPLGCPPHSSGWSQTHEDKSLSVAYYISYVFISVRKIP